ncbi:hypothetical protein OF83DRAFT_1284852 [Amylostereum chailletii]|nr:hypothetical protein OF83DRAFT_1284852 [Amylostereum chailletii]
MSSPVIDPLHNLFGPSARDLCDGCGQHSPGGVKLKKCSACGLAHYCTKECQKGDWRRHKVICKRIKNSLDALPDEGKLEYRTQAKTIGRWIDHWRPMFLAMAPFILDVEQYGDDIIKDRCIVLYIDKRPNPANRALTFRMTSGKVYPLDEWAKIMPSLDFTDDDIEMFKDPWAHEPNKIPAVRWAIVYGHSRMGTGPKGND